MAKIQRCWPQPGGTQWLGWTKLPAITTVTLPPLLLQAVHLEDTDKLIPTCTSAVQSWDLRIRSSLNLVLRIMRMRFKEHTPLITQLTITRRLLTMWQLSTTRFQSTTQRLSTTRFQSTTPHLCTMLPQSTMRFQSTTPHLCTMRYQSTTRLLSTMRHQSTTLLLCIMLLLSTTSSQSITITFTWLTTQPLTALTMWLMDITEQQRVTTPSITELTSLTTEHRELLWPLTVHREVMESPSTMWLIPSISTLME
ncbi:uncharacterized protein [Periplaneta americana]|uniref:uncharacterized protein n=1 Tax=Periplaneta americana TaxID=6978 RepID=UPI0037E933B7